MKQKNKIIFPFGQGNLLGIVFIHTIPNILFLSMSKFSFLLRVIIAILFNVALILSYKNIVIIPSKGILYSKGLLRTKKYFINDIKRIEIDKQSGKAIRNYKIEIFYEFDKIQIDTENITKIRELFTMLKNRKITFKYSNDTKMYLRKLGVSEKFNESD